VLLFSISTSRKKRKEEKPFDFAKRHIVHLHNDMQQLEDDDSPFQK